MTDEAERLQKLESHVATLERQIEQLNEVITEQVSDFEKMKVQFRRLSQSLESIELDRINATNAKPPHYQ